MNRTFKPIIVLLLVITSVGYADIFTNRSTGETFNGYALQKVINGKGRVYVETDGKFKAKTVILSGYDVKYDAKGRHSKVIVIPFREKDALMSKVVSETFAKTIIDASNRGPLYVIIELDNPGGRGDYMDIICKAITSTTNCPVIAYITGDKFGGVYGSATAIALACDKIYISPSASMGSLAPAFANPSEMDDVYSNMLNPANLIPYSGYTAKLAAKNNRPQAIAAAMMNRTVEVLEVSAGQKATRKFINSQDKVPSQNLVKRWTQTINVPSSQDEDDSNKLTLLTITGQDAIYCKMADKIAISQADLLYDLKASDAKVIKSPAIASINRKFLGAQKNLAKLIASIEYRQDTKEQLEKQLAKIITQDGNINIRLQTNDRNANYDNRNNNQRYSSRSNSSSRSRRNRNSRNDQMMTQTVQMDQKGFIRAQISIELVELLNGLITDYKKVIKYARKFPGAMPAGISIRTIDNKLTTAAIRLDNLYYRSY